MTPAQQETALDQVGMYLTKYGAKIGFRQNKQKHGTCQFVTVGTGHSLCQPSPTVVNASCTFVSFGINDDPSFDQTLAEHWNCRGFAADPTVDHPSHLHPLVTFHNLGATMLTPNEERLVHKGGQAGWWSISLPSLRFALGMDTIDILKLDCEGCEMALARDILREDPLFLQSVGQISLETHVTKVWIKTREDLYYFGLHFALLEEAGFVLEWSNVFGCSKRHEDAGCMDELGKYKFPCGYKPWPNHPNVVLGYSCHDFLWMRYPERATAMA